MEDQVAGIAAGALAFASAVGLALVKLGVLPLSAPRGGASCPDEDCKKEMVRSMEKLDALENQVFGVIAPKLDRIAEDVAFMRGRLEN
ncbi:MAG: hypothetical protein HZB23_08895 [Deltaproteobacteria bacterium]|nr:hypothetical protein [Deltaproteobacteria bacterium]